MFFFIVQHCLCYVYYKWMQRTPSIPFYWEYFLHNLICWFAFFDNLEFCFHSLFLPITIMLMSNFSQYHHLHDNIISHIILKYNIYFNIFNILFHNIFIFTVLPVFIITPTYKFRVT